MLLDSFTGALRLTAGAAALDGAALAESTDAPSGGVQGFVVTATYPYATVLTADGPGNAVVERWPLLTGTPLSGEAIIRAGADGVRADLRYRLLVRSKGENQWHRRTVVDALTVPLATS